MTINLEMAQASREQEMWEHRFHELCRVYPVERIFSDSNGRWGLRDFLDYAGSVCGFAACDVGKVIEAAFQGRRLTHGEMREGWTISDPRGPQPIAWMRDLDGTGSFHVCAKGDPRSFPVYRDSDGTATAAANGDLPVPQDCQARAQGIAQPTIGDNHDRG